MSDTKSEKKALGVMYKVGEKLYKGLPEIIENLGLEIDKTNLRYLIKKQFPEYASQTVADVTCIIDRVVEQEKNERIGGLTRVEFMKYCKSKGLNSSYYIRVEVMVKEGELHLDYACEQAMLEQTQSFVINKKKLNTIEEVVECLGLKTKKKFVSKMRVSGFTKAVEWASSEYIEIDRSFMYKGARYENVADACCKLQVGRTTYFRYRANNPDSSVQEIFDMILKAKESKKFKDGSQSYNSIAEWSRENEVDCHIARELKAKGWDFDSIRKYKKIENKDYNGIIVNGKPYESLADAYRKTGIAVATLRKYFKENDTMEYNSDVFEYKGVTYQSLNHAYRELKVDSVYTFKLIYYYKMDPQTALDQVLKEGRVGYLYHNDDLESLNFKGISVPRIFKAFGETLREGKYTKFSLQDYINDCLLWKDPNFIGFTEEDNVLVKKANEYVVIQFSGYINHKLEGIKY